MDRASDARSCSTCAVSCPSMPMRTRSSRWFYLKLNHCMMTHTGQRSWCQFAISVNQQLIIQLHVWLCANRAGHIVLPGTFCHCKAVIIAGIYGRSWPRVSSRCRGEGHDRAAPLPAGPTRTLSAAGGAHVGYPRMTARHCFLVNAPRFNQLAKVHPRGSLDSMWLQCKRHLFSFMPTILELNLCFLLFFCFLLFDLATGANRPTPVIRGGGGIRAPMSARVWGREPW